MILKIMRTISKAYRKEGTLYIKAKLRTRKLLKLTKGK